MKNLLVFINLLFVLTLSQGIVAQSWEKTFQLNGASSKGFDVLETTDGGYVVCGEADLPTGAIRHYIWALKTDVDGNELWSNVYNYNDISQDEGHAIVATPDGGFLIAGSNLEGYGQVLRISGTGDSLWTKKYFNGSSSAEAIIVNPAGGYLLVGGKVVSSDPDISSFWVLSLDENGEVLWEKTYPDVDAPGTKAYDIKSLADGGFIVGGTFQGAMLAIVKLDADGNQIWAEKYQVSTADEVWALEEMTNGEFLVGGYSTGFAGYSPLLLHLDNMGQQIDQLAYNIPSLGAISDIEKTADGGYILTGSGAPEFYYFVDTDKGFILKLNSNLEEQWDSLLKDNATQGTAILQTSDGGYIMSGYDSEGMLLKKIGGMINANEDVLLEKEMAVMVYPNPTTENLIFEFPEDAITMGVAVEIFTADGRLVKSVMIDEAMEIISLAGFTSGTYSYAIRTKSGVVASGTVVVW